MMFRTDTLIIDSFHTFKLGDIDTRSFTARYCLRRLTSEECELDSLNFMPPELSFEVPEKDITFFVMIKLVIVRN